MTAPPLVWPGLRRWLVFLCGPAWRWWREPPPLEMDTQQLRDIGLHGVPDAMLQRHGLRRAPRAAWRRF